MSDHQSREFLQHCNEVVRQFNSYFQTGDLEKLVEKTREFVFARFMESFGAEFAESTHPSVYNFFFNIDPDEIPTTREQLKYARKSLVNLVQGKKEQLDFTRFLDETFTFWGDEFCPMMQGCLQYWESECSGLFLICEGCGTYYDLEIQRIKDDELWRRFQLPACKSTLIKAGIYSEGLL